MNCNCECICKEKEQFCCEAFKNMERYYSSYTREHFFADDTILNFCPSCGSRVEKSLEDEWKSILMEEYNIEEDHCSVWNPMVPEEFKSDAWWRNRGL